MALAGNDGGGHCVRTIQEYEGVTAALLLTAMHLGHVAVIRPFDEPLTRCVYATEIFDMIAVRSRFVHHIRAMAFSSVLAVGSMLVRGG